MTDRGLVRVLRALGIRDALLRILSRQGYHLVRTEPPGPSGTEDVPDADCYRPFFSPWIRDAGFNDVYGLISSATIVSVDRCYVLWTLAHQALCLEGEFLECGVYRGGTARLLAEVISRTRSNARLHLFDTFDGMPPTTDLDLHQVGDFVDTSLAAVKVLVGHSERVAFHPGLIPGTFSGLENLRIALAHIDVDVFRSILDCCEFIYPRMASGGFMLFDDYGFRSCPGARKAVDLFFGGRPERPLVLANGQAIVVRCQNTDFKS